MKLMMATCLFSVFLLGSVSHANAQDQSILEDTYITTQEYVEAEVVRVKRDERILVVRGAKQGHIREFYVPEGAEITVKGVKARFRDMRRGDLILVTMSPQTERIIIAKIRVPQASTTLAERRAEPAVEQLPAALPQTASQWHAILLFGVVALFAAAFIRSKKA